MIKILIDFLHRRIKSFLYTSREIAPIYFKIRRTRSFSKNSLDLKLLQYLDKRNGTYVEIGAIDGIQQSNTKYFEVFKGWRGLLIEPATENFELLKKNRHRNNYFFNVACVPFEYQKPDIELIYSDLMTTPINLETDLESLQIHIDQSIRYLKKGTVHSFKAEARTMQSLLVETDLPHIIDLLSLDVEGSEISVLKGINHSNYRFAFILVECRNIKIMREYLETKDYEYYEQLSPHDFLFINKRTPTI